MPPERRRDILNTSARLFDNRPRYGVWEMEDMEKGGNPAQRDRTTGVERTASFQLFFGQCQPQTQPHSAYAPSPVHCEALACQRERRLHNESETAPKVMGFGRIRSD
jgi:hypothetical protein